MLTGALPLTAGAYAVPAPHSTYVGVALDSETGTVLKTLGRLLDPDCGPLTGMIRSAVTRELGEEMIGVRFTTAAFTPLRPQARKARRGRQCPSPGSPRTTRTHGS